VLRDATKLTVQEIYITRVSVCQQATLYRAQSGFQRGEGRKKSVSFTDSVAFSHKRPALQNIVYVIH